jgi:hypothetical protein
MYCKGLITVRAFLHEGTLCYESVLNLELRSKT